MIQKSFLIADSPICGNDQVISGTILYPWKNCMVVDEFEAHNKKVIEDALSIAEECEFSNIREVICYYQEVVHPQWGMVSYKKVRQRTIPFDKKRHISQ